MPEPDPLISLAGLRLQARAIVNDHSGDASWEAMVFAAIAASLFDALEEQVRLQLSLQQQHLAAVAALHQDVTELRALVEDLLELDQPKEEP